MPELVVYNDQGQAETVDYQALTSLLLNELQREHNQVADLRAKVGELSRQMANFKAPRGSLQQDKRLALQ